ncbi:MAG: prepilin-type N-terminal cleavage/methylation domain-containing protein [Planctomycetota bacterium]
MKTTHSVRTPAVTRSAFTLIELLVVISIIALLIGILLPALGAARNVSRDAVCLSNQRQIGIAMVSYATDNNTFLPRAAATGTTEIIGRGGVVVGSTDVNDDLFAGEIYWTGLLVKDDYMVKDTSFECPSFDESRDSSIVTIESASEDDYAAREWRNIDYSANRHLLGTKREGDWNYNETASLDVVKDPVETILTLDGWYRNADPLGPGYNPAILQRAFYVLGGYPNDFENPDARHGGLKAVNISYADGHAGVFQVADRYDVYATLAPYSLTDENQWDRFLGFD